MIVKSLPEGYRYATADEAEQIVNGSAIPDPVLVENEFGQCDIAIPIDYEEHP